jgi:hypothetical protein
MSANRDALIRSLEAYEKAWEEDLTADCRTPENRARLKLNIDLASDGLRMLLSTHNVVVYKGKGYLLDWKMRVQRISVENLDA